MLRRDVATALLVSSAGIAGLPKGAGAQSSTAPPYPQTPSEGSLGITPTDTKYPPYCVDRYATNAAPGKTDMWQAIAAANSVATRDRAAVVFQPGALYGVNITDARDHPSTALQATTHWVCSGAPATIQAIDGSMSV